MSKSEKSVKEWNDRVVQEKLKIYDKKTIEKAEEILSIAPQPITMFKSERSAGGIHDFYSEGDYWWPDPENPDGPYLRKDGLTNPENFVAHRKAMRNLNEWVATLVAAFKLSGDEKYAAHAVRHLSAFFLDQDTYMSPHLLYAQAIKGRYTGRGIGIIDTIHLIEVAKAIEVLLGMGYLEEPEEGGLKEWFMAYATWMNSHPYGLKEKDHGNNHSTWWAAQIAAFGNLLENEDLKIEAKNKFKKLLATQMDSLGRFPDEIERTKPFNYTLFNLEGYATICHLLSNEHENLWQYTTPNGTLENAWKYMIPYLKDKSRWPHQKDVSHFDELPIQSVGLLLSAMAYESDVLLEIWQGLSPEKPSEEIKRNYPYWQPVLWVKLL